MDKIIDRLDKYMLYSGLNDNQMTVQLNLSIGLLGKARKSGRDIGKATIEKILNFYSDINRVWLLTGEGEMLKSNYKQTEIITKELREPRFELDAIDRLTKIIDKLMNINEKINLENESLKEEIEELKKVASAHRGTA